jgi:hypothetical protein
MKNKLFLLLIFLNLYLFLPMHLLGAEERKEEQQELEPIKMDPIEKDSEEEEHSNHMRKETEHALDKAEEYWKKNEEAFAKGLRNYGGAGGPSVGYLFTGFEEINSMAQATGLPILSDNIVTIGGKGYGSLNRHFRIGGAGFGAFPYGEVASRFGSYTNLDFGLGLGGVTLDYAYQWGRTEWVLGGLIGAGGFVLELEGASTSNFDDRIHAGFFVAQPHIGVLYKFNRWFGLEVEASYLYTEVGGLRGSFGDGVDESGVDFSGFMLTLTPTFGWFID